MARLTSNSVSGFCLSRFYQEFSTLLPILCQKFIRFFPQFLESHMSELEPSEEVKTRLKGRVKGYPKLSRKNALLLPYKSEIGELRARNAAYDDIRLILAEENIIVSLNTIYRFCRDVLGEKSDQPTKIRAAKVVTPTVQPVLLSTTIPPATDQTSIQAALQEQRRERLPGLWGRRKRGPRIADSKNL
jgi:hypothetical protein